MLDYLPEFLDGLFNMLSDGNREIRQGAGDVLSDFLQEIKETEVVEFGPMVLILVCSLLPSSLPFFCLPSLYLCCDIGRTKSFERKVQSPDSYCMVA
jgi:hypothetical protein